MGRNGMGWDTSRQGGMLNDSKSDFERKPEVVRRKKEVEVGME